MNGFSGSLIRDLRYAVRTLPRRPAFTVAAVLTLALGIGATTAIFSVVYSVLINPLSYPNADELVRIRHGAPAIDFDDVWSDSTNYLTYREENRTFSSIGLWQERSATLTDRGEPQRVSALRVTHGTLQALGVQPLRGRWFTEQEHEQGAEESEPVILSYSFWRERFGGDETVLGRELSIDSLPSQVIGIMPREFRFLDMTPQPDVIVAVRLDPAAASFSSFNFHMLARLAPGVTAAEARDDVERMLPIWLEEWSISQEIADWGITPAVRPLKDDLVGGAAGTLWVLMGAIGLVLLIACANIANLMLVRADARRREFAVRAALGAVPARIARELFVESLVLGAAGGVLGGVLAHIGVNVLVAIGPSDLPRLEEIAIHRPVLVFTVAISLASTVMFGSITALKHAFNTDTSMSGSPRGSTTSRERSAARSTLVVVQVALALVLVVCAALMARTFQALRDVDPGFADPATIQTVRTWTPFTLFPDVRQVTGMQHEMLDRIGAVPGVAAAGFATVVPMGEPGGNGTVTFEGETIAVDETRPLRRLSYVAPGYFEAMGTRIVAGRDLTWNDIETGGRVVLISENFARDLAEVPAAAVGRRIGSPVEGAGWHEVIGVVQNVYQDGLHEDPPSAVYWPVLVANRFGQYDVTFTIRSERAGTARFVEEIRQAIRSVNGSVPVGQERTVRDLYAASFARTSFTLVLLAIAGAMALVLGVIGIYGVIAYVVSQRTREIGIRSALGAEPRQIKNMVLRYGLALGTVGIVLGLGAAVVLARVMSSLLFGITPMDPTAYVAALGIIFSAAALASYVPARRAARIDPMETLRAE